MPSRRETNWIPGALLGLGLVYLATKASRPQVPIEPRYIGMPKELLDFVAAAQTHDMWCWAACVQTILRSNGIQIDQAQIVGRIFGNPINAPGTDDTISASLNGWAIDTHGRRVIVRSRVTPGWPSPGILFQELSQQHPILIAVNSSVPIGHAVVITGLLHVGPRILSLIYRDPAPSLENAAKRGRCEVPEADLPQFLSSIRSYWTVSVSDTWA